jgi:TRAP-type uncharacterized transport system fused permease subunit
MKTNVLERVLLITAGLVVIVPVGWLDYAGLALFALVFVLQVMRRRILSPA